MIALSQQAALESVVMRYRRAKAEFDMLDQLSRTRALTVSESIAMERAMKRMDEWGAAQ